MESLLVLERISRCLHAIFDTAHLWLLTLAEVFNGETYQNLAILRGAAFGRVIDAMM